MGFLAPKAPDMPAPPPPPPPVPDIQQAHNDVKSNEALAKKRAGRAATMLTSTGGDLSAPNTATKQLLGG